MTMRYQLIAIAVESLSSFSTFHTARALSAAPRKFRPDAITTSAAAKEVVVTASAVRSHADIVALADLRYDEWIANSDDASNTGSSPASPPPPSRLAFRMATADISAERSEGGAMAFLARLEVDPNDDDDGDGEAPSSIPVGAAELSPIEFDGAIVQNHSSGEGEDTILSPTRFYVTDVVTSSKHRRMGIANTLMDALESYAAEKFETDNTLLYLHVKEDNVAAQKFYRDARRGYAIPTSDQLRHIDVSQLEENADTAGQVLLFKSLDCNSLPPPLLLDGEKDETRKQGFGGAAKGKQLSKKSKRKKKR